jgi:hypothetical protein
MSPTNFFEKATEFLGDTSAAAKDANIAIDNLKKGISGITGGLNNSLYSLDTFASSFDNIKYSIDSMNDSMNGFKNILNISGGGPITTTLGLMSSVLDVASQSIKMFRGGLEGFDSVSEDIRKADKSFYDLGRTIGLTNKEAMEMTDSLPDRTINDLSKSLYITEDRFISMTSSLKESNLKFDQLNQNIKTSYGNIDLYTMMIAQADSAGVTLQESVNIFDTLISKQGMTAQAASESMAGFSQIAEDTGIRFSEVKNILNQSISGFEKMGTTVEFGRPILERFASTVKDVGLGINVASDSTQDFVRNIAGLSDNYGLNFLTQIRGGGNPAGVLDASIQMRQRMREAEETGEQGSIAVEIAKQIRDTIASMTGGNIITLEQAANSPELQNQFYMQSQMLSQYGVRDTRSQDLVLDMLSKIDEASITGSDKAQQDLARRLGIEIEAKEKNMSETEKIDSFFRSQSAKTAISIRDLGESASSVALEMRKYAENNLSTVFDFLRDRVKDNNSFNQEDADGIIEKMKQEFPFLNTNEVSQPTPNTQPNVNNINEPPELNYLGDLRDLIKELINKISNQQIVKIELSNDAQKLVSVSPSGTAGLNTSP